MGILRDQLPKSWSLRILIGGVPGVFSYLNPRNGPHVIAFVATAVGLSFVAANRVLFGGGAEILAQHPGVVNGMGDGPGAIKPVVVAALVAQLAAFAAMWIIDFQSPSV